MLVVPVEPTVSVAVLITAPAGFVTVSVTLPPAGHPLRFSVNEEPRVPVFDGRTVTFGDGAVVGATVGTGVGGAVGTGVGGTVGAGVGGAVGTGVGGGGGGGATVGTGVAGVTVFVGVGSTSRTGVFVAGGGVAGAVVARGALVIGAVVPLAAGAGAVETWALLAAGAFGSTAALTSSGVADATSQPATATHDRSASVTARRCGQDIPR